jgi:hypothetical protein
MTGSGNKISDPFEITTDEWIIDWSYTPTDWIFNPLSTEFANFSFLIYPEGELETYVEALPSYTEKTDGSIHSDAGAGKYYLKVSADNIENWEVIIRPVL